MQVQFSLGESHFRDLITFGYITKAPISIDRFESRRKCTSKTRMRTVTFWRFSHNQRQGRYFAAYKRIIVKTKNATTIFLVSQFDFWSWVTCAE